jgi:hypothetical protein
MSATQPPPLMRLQRSNVRHFTQHGGFTNGAENSPSGASRVHTRRNQACTASNSNAQRPAQPTRRPRARHYNNSNTLRVKE